jgi:surface antigen
MRALLLSKGIREVSSIVCAVILLTAVVMPVVQAEGNCDDPATATATSGSMSDCQRKVYQSGVYAYDVASGPATCGNCSDGGSVSGANNAEKIWNKLKAYGLTSVAVAGIMGNWHEEATEALDPAVKQKFTTKALPDGGDGVTGFGLAQWTSQGRQAGLFAKMREANLGQYYGAGWGDPEIDKDMPAEDIDSLISVEITYAWEGDSTKIMDIADQLNKATTTAGNNGSAVLFHKLFERSADDASQIKERVTAAGMYLNQFGDSGGGVSGGGCAGELGGVSTMDDAIAWATKFINDTKAEYNGAALATATLIKDPQQVPGSGGTIMSLATFPEASSNFICWGAYGCDECTTLSGWFVTKMTGYTYQGGDGGEVVGNLKAHGVPTGSSPRPFSVFSYDTGEFGHTGVVLGTLGGGKVITLENNWPSNTLSVRQYDIEADYPNVEFAYVGDKLKVTGLNQTNP